MTVPLNPLDPRVLDKITRLDVRARSVVEGFITGLHRSPYHGFAVEFASHREYVPGDEIKHIDWKVWSKTDRLYIKEYEEETNLRCHILLDCSKSMRYGEGSPRLTEADRGGPGMSKFAYAATCAACLAYLLQQQQDAVGLVMFDQALRKRLPASSHPSHLKLLVNELQQAQPDHRTDVGDVFRLLAESIGRRGLVVLISDLLVDLPTLKRSLQQFRARGHEVVVLQVLHEHELTFPFVENTLFKGLELPAELLTEPRALRRAYLDELERFQHEVRRTCATAGIDHKVLSTAEPLDAALAAYLAFRQKTHKAVGRR